MEPSTHRGGRPLDGTMSHVAYGEDVQHVRLHKQGKALQVSPSSRTTIAGEVLTGDSVAPRSDAWGCVVCMSSVRTWAATSEALRLEFDVPDRRARSPDLARLSG